MKRAILLAAIVCLACLAAACSGGGDNVDDELTGPLTINFVAASPSSGPSPLRATFTTNISGGKAPYFYAWDFTNDGAFDRYVNAEFNRTISVDNDYFLRASDAGGNSSYEAVLRVRDSEGTEVLSDPVTVVVSSSGGVTIPPETAVWFTDEQLPDGSYVARSGVPVFFRATVVGGEAPFKYHWDFNNDGEIDSTVEAPQFTFTNNETGAKIFVVHLTVIDDSDQRVFFDYLVPVFGSSGTPPPSEGFELILNSAPEAGPGTPYPVIELTYDPTGATSGVPREPQLDLSVTVDPSTENGGTPPFEYYWDFNNDGAFDSQDASPTIPFYDPDRRLFINPYLHQEDFKAFTLRVMVLDSGGKLEERFRTVLAKNVADGGFQLTVDNVDYGVGGVSNPPYGQVDDEEDVTSVDFQLDISGSTGQYEYTFDGNGDGDPDLPLIDHDDDPGTDPEPGFGPISGSTLNLTVDFQGLGYFPAQFNIRSVQGGSVADTVSVDTPVSLVDRRQVTVDGSLATRVNHGVTAVWNTAPGGGNGTYLEDRQLVIAGGSRGTTLLRSVQRVTETFSQPAEAGDWETSADVIVTDHFPMNLERSGLVMWTDGSNVVAQGGTNPINGILASNEWVSVSDPGMNQPWTVLKEIRVPGFYPLTQAQSIWIPDDGNAGTDYDNTAYMCGGLHPPIESDADNVSGRLLAYVPSAEMAPGVNPWGDMMRDMVTERYDAAAAFVNNRMYVIGGRVASGESVATVEAYNFATESWEFYPPMQDARSGATAQVIGGRIYVHGGGFYPSNESAVSLLNTSEVYNPVTGVWSYTLPLNTASNNGAAARMPGPGSVSDVSTESNTIWYFGGEDTGGAELSRLEEFVYFHTVFPPEVPAP